MTEKRAREMLHRIWFHYERLQRALTDAHEAELIVLPDVPDQYNLHAPCASLWQCRQRIEATTKEQLSDLIHREIRRKL